MFWDKVSYCVLIACTFYTYSNPSFRSLSSIEKAIKNYPIAHIIQTLRYDPLITVYPSVNNTPCKNGITLYVHDLLENQSRIPFLQRNTDVLPGTIIGFNFKDAMRGSYMPDIKEINFGQSKDIASLLMVLTVLDACDVPSFHLFGTGRGAQTIVTTIARLKQYNHHKRFFKKLGICKTQAHQLLEKIIKGTLVLNCPLIDVSTSIKDKLAPFGMQWASSIITRCILPRYTSYAPNKDHGLKAAEHMSSLAIPTLIHFQQHNLIYGNTADATGYKALMGSEAYLVLGNNGGHEHGGECLAPALHAFRSFYGGPHYIDKTVLQKGIQLLENAQPSLKEADAYIHNFYAHSTYTFTPKPHISWQNKFKNYDVTPLIKRLGYDPSIRIYQADALSTDNGATVYVHGYGDNYKFTIPLMQRNTYMLPGTIVGFNFQDVTEGAFKLKIDKSSIGQSADIAAFVSVLKVLDECGLNTINLFGYSRGGATVVTGLARLCTYDCHQEFFKNLQISKEQASRLVDKIKKGTIVLNCPLIHTRAVAHYWFGNLGNMILNSIIPRIMEHRGYEDQALDAAHIIKNHNFNILVHFQRHDTILGNSLLDGKFYNSLKGPHTYLVIADEGGHIHTGETLGNAVQAFKKKYHAAYYPMPDVIEKGTKLLQQSPITNEEVMNYIAHSYQETLLPYNLIEDKKKSDYTKN